MMGVRGLYSFAKGKYGDAAAVPVRRDTSILIDGSGFVHVLLRGDRVRVLPLPQLLPAQTNPG